MCNKCYGEVSKDVPSITRSDLEATEQLEIEDFDYEGSLPEDLDEL
jgi:hypothetical protein